MDPEEIQKTPPNPEGETREVPSDPGVETNDVADPAAGRRIWEGRPYPRVGSSPSVAIFRQIMSTRTWGRRVGAGVKRAAPQSFLPTNGEGSEEGVSMCDEESVSMCDGGGTMIFQMKMELLEPRAKGMPPKQ